MARIGCRGGSGRFNFARLELVYKVIFLKKSNDLKINNRTSKTFDSKTQKKKSFDSKKPICVRETICAMRLFSPIGRRAASSIPGGLHRVSMRVTGKSLFDGDCTFPRIIIIAILTSQVKNRPWLGFNTRSHGEFLRITRIRSF